MWKWTVLVSLLIQPAFGYFLTESDKICREESWFYYWKTYVNHENHNHSPYDISNSCQPMPQMWYGFLVILGFFAWLFMFIPVIGNFIEGIDRRQYSEHK